MNNNTQHDTELVRGDIVEITEKTRQYRNLPPETLLEMEGVEFEPYPEGDDWDVDEVRYVVDKIETRVNDTLIGEYEREVVVLHDRWLMDDDRENREIELGTLQKMIDDKVERVDETEERVIEAEHKPVKGDSQ